MSYTPAEQRIVEKSAERVHLALARIAGARAQFTMDGEPMDVAAFIAVNQQDDLDYMGEILAAFMDRLAGLKPGEEMVSAGVSPASLIFKFKRVDGAVLDVGALDAAKIAILQATNAELFAALQAVDDDAHAVLHMKQATLTTLRAALAKATR